MTSPTRELEHGSDVTILPDSYWRSRYGGHSRLALVINKIDYRDPNGCWLWTGAISDMGYGTKGIGGRERLAHRLMFQLYYGSVPEGLTLDHICKVTRCVNPEHLEPVTQRENVLRGEGPSSRAARVTHCPYGHPYAGDNVDYTSQGSRACKTCRKARQKAYYARQKETCQ